MNSSDFLLLFAFILVLALLTPLVGHYMAKVYSGDKTFAHYLLGWLERLLYRLGGIDSSQEMGWKHYFKALFLFNTFGFIFLFLLLLIQNLLPLNPQNLPAVPLDLSFNTAASFVTNTNWQAYSGEATLSYLTQMLGLASLNFLSAATGLATLLTLVRGLTRKTMQTIGNFWCDLVRTIVYLLLPLSILLALFLVSEGVIQNLSPYVTLNTVEKGSQTIPMGPVASQIAIKQLGTNGGGFFNANSAHPFENPTPLSNFIEMIAILMIPAASVYMFGIMTGSKRHGVLLLGVMGALWFAGLAISVYSEQVFNPNFNAMPMMEGKETRFGMMNSLLWTVSTSGTSNGSVNAMLSSLSPLTGGIALFNIISGELILGGVGVGLCSMLMFVLLTVFLAGLMVGRTPEYFGKKIEKREIQWVVLAVLTPAALILIGSSLSAILPTALTSLGNSGPHGLSEILYAFASSAGNNGSAFASLNANTPYYNLFLGVIMLLARLGIILPSIAIAGLLANKKITPPSLGTFSTNSFLFATLLFGVILIVGALTFFPALSLGPGIEQLLMLKGITF